MTARHRAALVLMLVLTAATARIPSATAQSGAAPVPPEQAERTARDVVDGLGLDEPPPDRNEPPAQMPGSSAFGVVGEVLAYLLVGAAAAGLVYVVVALVRRGRRHDHGGDDDDDGDVAVESGRVDAEDDVSALTAAQWRARAAEAEAQGRFADAVRYLHFSGLIGLDEDGLVAFDPGRANGEYVRLVAALAPGGAPADLGHLNRLMEDATFGKRDLDAAALDWSRDGWERVRSGIGAAGARAL